MKKECGCGTAPKLIFTCSGASDVGEITDRAARELTREGAGKMYCLAGIGGGVSGIIESTKAAAKVLVIEGCAQDCARKTLERAGFSKFEFIRLSDMGLAKGKSPVSPESITRVMTAAKEVLAC